MDNVFVLRVMTKLVINVLSVRRAQSMMKRPMYVRIFVRLMNNSMERNVGAWMGMTGLKKNVLSVKVLKFLINSNNNVSVRRDFRKSKRNVNHFVG